MHYLRTKFDDDIRAIVPQIAMSAGTMMALSCKEILMGDHSNLGPIDPHLRGIPAQGVIEEFKRAYKEISEDKSPNKLKLLVWRPILEQYRPTFLSQCEHAIKMSNEFVEDQLAEVMFKGDDAARLRAGKIVKAFSSVSHNKTHDKHIHADRCEALDIKLSRLEKEHDLQDLVLTVHHCYMHSFMNTQAYKIIENQNGVFIAKYMRQKA